MDAEAEHERNAIQNFLIEVTLPIIATVQDTFCIIGTGTLFRIANRLFLVSAAHILDEFTPDRWAFPTGPHTGTIMTFGQAEFFRPNDESADVCIAELKDPNVIAVLERSGWRILSLHNVWLPDYSADRVYLSGFPSVRAKFEQGNLKGRLFVVPTSLHAQTPEATQYSADAVTKGVDFFMDYKKPINELTGEDVSDVSIKGTSGCSIWGYRKIGWRRHGVWSPEASLCVIGVQSAFLKKDYLRGKSWGVVMIALSGIDDEIKNELTQTVEEIHRKLEAARAAK